jgi:hypothetical protein
MRLVAATLGLLAPVLMGLCACGREAAVPPRGLEAAWVVGGAEGRDRLEVSVARHERVPLALRVTNRGPGPVQIVVSSYPAYRFFHADVRRAGGGDPLPAYWDLYPTKDMAPPGRLYVTLAPGAAFDREMDVLLREGHLLETFAESTITRHLEGLRERGFGALREPGTYTAVGRYSTVPQSIGEGHAGLFGGDEGRDPGVPLAASTEVRTPPLTLVVVP